MGSGISSSFGMDPDRRRRMAGADMRKLGRIYGKQIQFWYDPATNQRVKKRRGQSDYKYASVRKNDFDAMVSYFDKLYKTFSVALNKSSQRKRLIHLINKIKGRYLSSGQLAEVEKDDHKTMKAVMRKLWEIVKTKERHVKIDKLR
jgi:hypothetical protein